MKRDDPIEDVYPLSPMQQGMLFHTLRDPESGVYTIQLNCVLAGDLDLSALKAAWRLTVERHSILRTAFVWKRTERPLQVVYRTAEPSWEELDWRDVAAPERDKRLEWLIAADQRRCFELQKAPLMRLFLIRASEDTRIFLWSVHHLLLDGWSVSLLLREVFELYGALRQGEAPQLESVRPFVDYIQWLQRQDMDAAEAFWRETLAGFAEPTPLDGYAGSAAPDALGAGALKTLVLTRAEAAALRSLARRHDLTLNTVFQGAWALVLARSSGRSDVVFGAVVSGRPAELPGSQSMVGLFINTLPVRATIAPQATAAVWLRELQKQQLAQRRYEHTPLVKIQVWSGLPAGHPLFHSLLVFENYPVSEALGSRRASDLQIRGVRAVERTNYPLTIAVLPGPQTTLILEYDASRLSGTTIQRLGEQFRATLRTLAENPEGQLCDLALLGAAERLQLLVEWNDTRSAFPGQATLSRMLEDQVERSPDSVALSFGSEDLTYIELDRRANRLARFLRGLGIGPEDRVALWLERSLDLVVGIVAILKAGGAYVPLDPAYPGDRLAYMLADAQARILLTQQRLLPSLPATPVRAVCLDRGADVEKIAAQSGERLPAGADLDNLAYVIYTSGSTGRPKGVMVSHRAIANRLLWKRHAFPWAPDDRLLQKTPSSFDASIWEIFVPLMAGARLVVAEPGGHQDTRYLLRAVAEHRITVLQLVPSVLSVFLEEEGIHEDGCSLRQVFAGGEALKGEVVERFFSRLGARLQNLYGATETAIDVASRPCQPGPQADVTPLGRPLPNCRLYILGPHGEPLPAGAPGELHVGGVHLARGYLGRPDLTAERFVPDPFGEAGDRLYRTGDLARYRPDGEIDYLGRTDHQVKLRGFRIELGEIETALRRHPRIREAVVVVREDRPGIQRLVAYVVGSVRSEPDIEDLRTFVAGILPEFMVPAAFVPLDSLPLTPNGKLDRNALPAPEWRSEDRTFVAPRTPVEEKLAAIWQTVLGVERVGVHDGFFALGGDSILAIRVIARAHREGLSLTPRQVFQHQTVAELAAVVGTEPGIRAEQGGVQGEVPLTPIQSWFFEHGFADPHHWNQALLLASDRPLELPSLLAALSRLTDHHDALRLRFERKDAGWRQFQTAPGEGEAAASAIDLSRLPPGRRREALDRAASQAQESLDLARGPLLRAALFDLGMEGGTRLLLVAHHLVVDGISWRILLEDLQLLHEAQKRGEVGELPPKTSSFKHWSERLADLADSDQVAAELPYWAGLAEEGIPDLPVDHPGGRNTVGCSETVSSWLDERDTRALLQETPSVYRTEINDALLSALARVLAGWTGREVPLLVALEGHGREPLFDDIDVSRTVGWFTSYYPVLLEGTDTEDPGETLRRTKERLRGIPNHGIGYGLLRHLSKRREAGLLRNTPGPQIGFNYLGQLDQVAREVSWFRLASESAGLDRSPRGERTYRLEIVGNTVGGRLNLRWTYSRELYRRATIERLAENLLAELRSLIAHCRDPLAGGFTPSDFPLADAGPKAIETLIRMLARNGESPRNVRDVYPLSPLQESLLIHALSSPGSRTGFEQITTTLIGEIDRPVFEETWRRVVERQTILRTAFFSGELERPLQVVLGRVGLMIEWQDWRELPPPEQNRRLGAELARDLARGFDLQRPPLMRLALYRLRDDAYQLIWSCHHLVIDAWCREILLREVFSLYAALRRGEAGALPPAPPFRRYIEWLRRQDFAHAEEVWRRVFDGFSGPTPLRWGRPSSEIAAEKVRTWTEEIGRDTTEELRAFARRHGLTPNTLLHGAWALLLRRYSGRHDPVFGTTVSGRPADLPEVETMAGMFINNLPVRVKVEGGEAVLPWLQQLQDLLVELRQFEYCSPAQIQEWSGWNGGRKLFDSLIVFQNHPFAEMAEEISSHQLAIRSTRARVETGYLLTLIAAAGSSFLLSLHCDAERVEAVQAERMIGHLRTLLAAMPGAEGPLASLPLLTRAERHQLVIETAAGEPRPGDDGDILRLFLTHASRSPQSVAIADWRGDVSYAELARQAASIAFDLKALGVGPETLVSLCFRSPADLTAAILGVLGTGGCFMVMSPELSAEAAARAVGGRRPAAFLADADRVRELTQRLPCPVLTLSDLMPPTSGVAFPVPLLDALAAALPSGADPCGWFAISHRALAGVVRALTDRLDLAAGNEVIVRRDCGAGALALNALLALSSGGRLVVVDLLPAATAAPVERFAAPFPAVRPAGAARPRLLISVRALSRGLADDLARAEYEPWSVQGTAGLPQAAGRVSATGTVGVLHSLEGCRIHVLDPMGDPVPIGLPGLMGGSGELLPREVLGDPAATAGRLRPDPFATEPGTRILWTGDLVKRAEMGDVEWLGEILDGEVAEGEIERSLLETALRHHPGLWGAVAELWRGAPGGDRWVAQVVAGQEPPDAGELRRFLRWRVPEGSVPSEFVFSEQLPQGKEGEIDRAALHRPEEALARLRHGAVAPRTPLQLALVRIWEDLFGVRPIGITDDFFELGGHSALAIRLMARLRSELGREVPLTTLVEAATVQRLTAALESHTAPRVQLPLVEIQRGRLGPPLFCVHPGGGGAFCYVNLAWSLGPDQPFYGLQAPGWQDAAEPLDRVEDMADLYLESICQVQPAGPYWLAGWSFGGLVAYEMARRLQEQGQEVALVALLDTDLLADPSRAPTPDTTESLLGFLRFFADSFPLQVDEEQLRSRGGLEAQTTYVLQEGKRQGVLPDDLDLPALHRFFRVFQGCCRAETGYRPPRYEGSVLLFKSRERGENGDPTLGWDQVVAGGVRVLDIPGHHDQLMSRPWVYAVAEGLRPCLRGD